MAKTKSLAVAITVAGSDSGGGAGVTADVQTFAAFGVHGTCAITCVTAQNPAAITGRQPCRPRIVREQLEAVFAELPPAAAKTGMLHSAAIVRTVVEFFAARPGLPLVVDPVMVATSGARLLAPEAVRVLQARLLPLATLITPNLEEVAVLLGRRPRNVEEMRTAARGLHGRFGVAVLVKGGHLAGSRTAADIFFDGRDELLLTAPFIPGLRTHGTGCAYSAAVTAALARGHSLPVAVALAKEFMAGALANCHSAHGHTILGLLSSPPPSLGSFPSLTE